MDSRADLRRRVDGGERAGRVPAPRRQFLGLGVGGAATVAMGAVFWRDLFAGASSASSEAGFGYGPRRPPDASGIRLPRGFRSRLVATGGRPVPGTGYRWHVASDGTATFRIPGGGWVLVSKSETLRGGASAIRFAASSEIVDGYRILDGTTQNCSGGATPWGTWLWCEEIDGGFVWECDPLGRHDAVKRTAMGAFKHEAAAVDSLGRRAYMTEDLMDGGFYRFTPERWPDLRRGLLEIAVMGRDKGVSWREVPDPSARRLPTRRQVPGSLELRRGEGIWHDDGVIHVATTGDSRVHAYDVRRERFEVVYDGIASPEAPLLRVDQLTANQAGEVFVCEDVATDEIDIGVLDQDGHAARFLSATGARHEGSELTGVTFDPSGSRMYFFSQRAGGRDGIPGPGEVYEV